MPPSIASSLPTVKARGFESDSAGASGDEGACRLIDS
jgi:hypothetical protein